MANALFCPSRPIEPKARFEPARPDRLANSAPRAPELERMALIRSGARRVARQTTAYRRLLHQKGSNQCLAFAISFSCWAISSGRLDQQSVIQQGTEPPLPCTAAQFQTATVPFRVDLRPAAYRLLFACFAIASYRSGEAAKIANLIPRNGVHDFPVDLLIAMDCDISKTDGCLEAAT